MSQTPQNVPAASTSPPLTSSDDSAAAYAMLLLLVTAVIWSGHSLRHSRLTFITDGSLALLWGLAAGAGAFFVFGGVVPPRLISFNYDIYMQLLLPPIIFYAGFSVKRKEFFANVSAIAVLGIGATFLCAALLSVAFAHALHVLGLDSARLVGNAVGLGTVFASTDSVAALAALDPATAPLLHALVFGEAVVNDATAIVLLKSVQHVRDATQLTAGALALLAADFLRLAAASMALGAGVGLAAAYILKHSFRRRHSTDHEVSLLAALGFLSFLGAESLGLSGVLAAFFTGITMSHYAWHSLSPSAKVASIYAFRVLSFLAELVMFLSCGLDLWSTRLWDADILVKKAMMRKTAALTAWIVAAVPAARFAAALPLVAVINAWREPGRRIGWREAAALGWAGCSRGAVTLALAVNHFLGGGGGGGGDGDAPDPETRAIAAASMAAVVLSTVVLGGATPAVLGRLLEDRSGSGGGGGGGSGGGSGGHIHERKQSRTYATALGGAALREPLLGGQGAQPAPVPGPVRVQPPVATAAASAGGDLSSSLHSKWTALDRRLLQPLFGGRTLSFRDDGGGSPPSPGRWQGAASAVHVLSRAPDSGSGASHRPSPFASSAELADEAAGGEQQQGVGVSRRLSSGGLDGLFAAPGHAECEDAVDREVEEEGLVHQAASFLEH